MKHDHTHCKHAEVAYCGDCQAVYCKGCKREWSDCKLSHGYTYTSPTADTITFTGFDHLTFPMVSGCSHA